MSKKKKTPAAPRPRNWAAVAAHFHKGAGNHGDAKKAASKGACRGEAMTPTPDSLALSLLMALGMIVNVILWGCIL